MSTQMMADDGFAGAGGWDLAAEALGIHARGIENMKEARATRDAAGLVTIHDDVPGLALHALAAAAGVDAREVAA